MGAVTTAPVQAPESRDAHGPTMLAIDGAAVRRALAWPDRLRLSGIAFRLQSSGEIDQPLRQVMQGPQGLMGTMPVGIRTGPYAGFGLKSVVVDFSGREGEPSHRGVVLVYGEPGTPGVAAVDAGAITELRTAAASAWATDLLAREDASVLAVLGTGLQARAHVEAMRQVRPVRAIRAWGRDAAKAEAFVHWCRSTLKVDATAWPSPAEAVAGADIVCTTTAARTPFLKAADLPAGVHVNAIGASARGFQELDPDVFRAARVHVDSVAAVMAASESARQAVERGHVAASAPGIEIGTLEGRPAREASGITVFHSVGLAVQDLVFAREVVRRTLRRPSVD